MHDDADNRSKHTEAESIFDEVDQGLEAMTGGDVDPDDLKRRNSIMETLLNVSTSINSTISRNFGPGYPASFTTLTLVISARLNAEESSWLYKVQAPLHSTIV